MTAVYVAPARRPLTVLHLADDGDRTVCALPMDEDELWTPVERRDGDRVCPACAEPPLWPAGHVQETLL